MLPGLNSSSTVVLTPTVGTYGPIQQMHVLSIGRAFRLEDTTVLATMTSTIRLTQAI
jgi:hypothetical protein